MQYNYDAIVVGAGPGGSAAAIHLGRAGFRVLLVDKSNFPRDKACGDGVSGKSIKYLRELDVLNLLPQVSTAMSGILVTAPNGRSATIEPPARLNAFSHGYVCRRMDLDNILFQEAARHVETRTGVKVVDLIKIDGRITGVRLKNETGTLLDITSKVVIGADGATSIVAAKLGEKRLQDWRTASAIRAYYRGVKELSKDIELHFFKDVYGSYFWIFPLPEGRANVGLGINMQVLKKHKVNLTRCFKTLLNDNPMLRRRFADAHMEGSLAGWTIPSGVAVPKVAFDGCLLVGDAAHIVDPFTGEGIGNALASAQLAAESLKIVLKSNNLTRQALLPYERNLKKLLAAEFRASALLHLVSRSEVCLNALIGRLATSQLLKNYVSSTIFNEHPGTVGLTAQLILRSLFPSESSALADL